jgi:hypothetical protein
MSFAAFSSRHLVNTEMCLQCIIRMQIRLYLMFGLLVDCAKKLICLTYL